MVVDVDAYHFWVLLHFMVFFMPDESKTIR